MDNSVHTAVEIYIGIMNWALPISIVFGLSNMLVDMFVTAVTRGKLKIGGEKF